MALPLATDIRIAHGGDTVQLIPSLRAAYLLNSLYGIGRLEKAVGDFNVSIIRDMLAHSGNGAEAVALFDRKIDAEGYRAAFTDLSRPVDEFLVACFAINSDPTVDHPAEARAKAGEPFDLTRFLSELFEFATGWLGWTPAEAWAATPSEIVVARRGLVAKLRACNGVTEKDAPHDDTPYDPREEISEDRIRAGIARLKIEAARGKR